jgi:acyl transferase domain-containing protein/thioesterase domain-containing protein
MVNAGIVHANNDDQGDMDIAIVGMSCRFPEACNLEEFWNNLAAGVESITRLSDDEILRAGVPQSFLKNPSYVKAAPILEEPGLFDAGFFGFSPMEAKSMDPQHRILLELAFEALENAACDSERYSGRIGVFTGSAMNTYFMNSGLSDRFAKDYIPTLIVNDKDFLSTRISYKLNLKGPSITIQTACSTSLVAVHLARQSLLSEETDMALAGAISVRVPHRAGYFCDGGGIVSPDGHVRAFDAKANGTVFGSGGGIIVLKRLADALAGGDTIHAVIKGSAVNNDGSEKAGYTAPSVNSQADAVVEALANAGVEAESITYIEAHGSGTPVGDPIEISALTKAFRTFTQRSAYCGIGSVKTNVGHLDAAAGIAGIIKTALALKHQKLPPSLHYTQPNPEINFPATPFYVNTKLVKWESTDKRRAGVLSTGMGGTNACIVLEEAPASAKTADSGLPHLLILSAKSATALDTAANRLLEFLQSNPNIKMEDVAYTLQTGRKAFPHRRVLVCAGREDAIVVLNEKNSKRVVSSQVDESVRCPVIFLIPGVGDHYVGMAQGLYERCEVFRHQVDCCAALFKQHLGVDILQVIYPDSFSKNKEIKSAGIDLRKMLGGKAGEPENPATQKLNKTVFAQPALFTIEYSLARLWQHLGIAPDAIVGHSMGEYVAACLAGVFTLEDAVRLISQRAKLANELPQGAMLAVMLPEAEILPLLNEQLSISLINGPNLCVVAGPVPVVAEFERTLDERNILTRPVKNAHAFHSKMLDPIVPTFAEEVRKVKLSEPKIPFISNVTGNWITKGEAVDPNYWARHANHTARFSDALHHLWHFKDAILLETGPGKTLGVLAAQHPDRRGAGNPVTVSSLRHHYENHSDVEFLWQSIGRLWLAGIDLKWEKLPPARQRRKVPLPTYPFERANYWIEPTRVLDTPPVEEAFIHKNPDLSTWFYVPSWKRTLARRVGISELSKSAARWLVFSPEGGLTAQLLDRLKASGQKVVTVRAGGAYQEIDANNFLLRPDDARDYELLIQRLQRNDWNLDYIIHAWSLTSGALQSDSFQHALDLGFYSLLFLARALAKLNFRNDLKLFALSDNTQEVHGNEKLTPEKATLLGPCMVIPQEYPNLRIKNIDLELSGQTWADELLIDQLAGEFLGSDSELSVAYRNNHRWIQTYEQVELARPDTPTFRENGVYLITGGLGNIGYEISKYLAKNYRARLLLVGRSCLPAKSSWNAWIADHPADDGIVNKIRRITEIESLGGEVVYLNASVHEADRMRSVIKQAYQQFGDLHGVVHGAGVIGANGYREVKDVDVAHGDLHFHPKAHGLRVLKEVLDGKTLDFCLLLSSLTSILGGVGQAAYASSNIFMDVFARRHNRSNQTPWLSVNWDVWRMQNDAWNGPGLGRTLAELGMTAEEAITAMEVALSVSRTSQVIVSTGDLQARIRQWIKRESIEGKRESTQLGPAQSTGSERPNLPANYQAPRNKAEEVVTTIWQNVLGIRQVGTNDNFADLGGHSLLAIKIVAELRNAFQVDLPVRALFDTPTVAGLSAYIDEQKSVQQRGEPIKDVRGERNGSDKSNDILELLRKENPELRLENAFVVPHWFIQQKSWLDDSSNSDSAIYNYPLLLRIRGALNQEILRHSLQEIVRRHQVLRSVFRRLDGELIQIVVSPERQSLPVTDLGGLAESDREAQIQRLALAEANQAFDLGKGPLLRSALIRLDPDDHILQLTTHHLVHDDWSTGILSRELWQLYQAFAAGADSTLPDLTFHYADYVRWHQEQLQRQTSRVSFWKQQLSSATSFEHLMADFARPARTSDRGARERIELRTDLADSLKAVSRHERVSLFMVLLAGFQCLLHHYSRHEEIGIASCAANRPLGEVEGLMGRFGNDILLRTSLSGDPTFRELLVRVRDTALTAYADQNIPFGALLQNHASGTGPNRKLPFQVMFILQNAPRGDYQVPGLNVSWVPFYNETAKYDLNVWLKVEPALEVILEYRATLFRASTIKKILEDYQAILENVSKNPGARISNLLISRKTERVQVPAIPPARQASLNGAVPKDDVQSRLVELWEAAFKIKPISVDHDFFQLGGDSLLGARLFTQMEKTFQVDLPLTALLEAPTIRQLAEIIGGRKTRSPHCLAVVQPLGTRPPLFCVHGHTGNILFTRKLSRSLGPDQPLYGLAAKGLSGEEPHHTIEDMAADYLREIQTVQPRGPYYISGYCFGGMVAYEMAKLLKTQGEEVALLVLFNAPSPGSLKGWPFRPIFLTKRITYELRKLLTLGTKEKLVALSRRVLGLSKQVRGTLERALWRALPKSSSARAGKGEQRLLSLGNVNILAAKAYDPPPYTGRIVLFVTEEVGSRYAIDPQDGWTDLATHGIEIYPVAGDNFSLFDEGIVEPLAEKLRFCLAHVHRGEEEIAVRPFKPTSDEPRELAIGKI